MMFPLDIIVGLCERSSIAVLKQPKHPNSQFGWISAIPDTESISSKTVGNTVYVVENVSFAPKNATCVITRPDPDKSKWDQNSDHIFISTDLPPITVADILQRRLVNIIQWNDKMAQMLEDGCINQDLLKASESVLKCYVGLSDSTFSHIAHTPNLHPLDKHSQYFVEHGCYSQKTVDQIRQSGLMHKWNSQDFTIANNDESILDGFPYASHVIKRHGRYAAHLIMVSPTRITPHYIFLFNLLAKKVEVCLSRYWRLENPLEQRYTYFLKEVLSGNTYDKAGLEERARMHGLPTTGLFEICVANSAWKTMPTEYFARLILTEIPECKVAVNEEKIVVLICADSNKPQNLIDTEKALCNLAQRMDVEIGVSDRFTHLSKADFALEKARIALNYGHRYSQRYIAFEGQDTETTTMYRFYRYFPYFATDPFAHSEKFIAKLIVRDNPIAGLRTTDKTRGTNDYEILRVYLRSEGHINMVCEIMHMHRNTVMYRLSKIKQAIGEDLDNGDVRMYLRILYLLSD
ncbi:helix-turn-helix domain-containing protein [Adlercreutzia sp. ZJ304]|uniref:PucR family transcriptional regulator n=1 Tax=Adlercreutzia sp. ZJ304 TaxID=2709791 RepID=UPI0013E9FBFE|nr:helix-turn-helix domain-containing protein [Adlercreutzia sp. ZJ304]